jgi:DNA-binding Lrp family transcriptional regulator
MVDSTNMEGVATLGFEVPFGNIARLTARAIYDGSQSRWGADFTEETGVEVSILALVMSFLMSDIGILMIISIALLGIVAAGYNRGVKPKKKAARLSLENQLQMFNDLETVQHFMAVYLDRGTCVFYHPFTNERIQPDLISGFIAAITSVYGEIKGDGVRGTLEEIQYHGLRLNSYSGQYIIGILILEGEMTTLLRERLQFFVELFENQYDQDLDGWTGLVDCFDPEWVVSTLNASFNYAWHLPHRFGPTQKVTKMDAKILDYIGAIRDEWSEFYIKNLITPLAEMLDKTEAEVLDRLLLLQDRGIIIPIGIQTILQRQGLALVNGSEETLSEPPDTVDEPVSVDEPLPEEASPESVEELQFDEIKEEMIAEEPFAEVIPEPEPEPEDEMEAFVQDVESLLAAKAEDEKKEDDDLDEFVKELRAKIAEGDEEEED